MSRSSTARLLARLKTEGPVAPPNPQETNTNKPKRNRKRKRKDDNTLVVEKKQKEEMAEAENLPAVSIPPEPQPEQVVDSVSIPSEPQPEQAVDTVTYLPSFKGLHHDTTNYTSINFLKNVKWSPDGRCFLTNSEDHILRLYDSPPLESASESVLLQPCLKVYEGEDVYDYAWYPFMRSEDLSTCVFLSTSRDHPIHLWDAYSGKSRTSYVAYDDADEPTAAFSLCFNPSGDKIFAGYNKLVCVWDVSRPGRDYKAYTTVPIKSNRPQKRHVSDELSLNVIQCNPDHSGLVACGSFNKKIGVYAEKKFEPLAVLEGHVGGITSLKWSPCGRYLYSGARKDDFIHCWDIRNTCQTLFKMERKCTTNQRMYFDIDPSGSYLHTGDQLGNVLVYDLNNSGQLLHKQAVHDDSCNSVSLHPSHPYMLTGCGQRRFSLDMTDSDSEEEETPSNPSVAISTTPFYYYYDWTYHNPDSSLTEWTETRTQTTNAEVSQTEAMHVEILAPQPTIQAEPQLETPIPEVQPQTQLSQPQQQPEPQPKTQTQTQTQTQPQQVKPTQQAVQVKPTEQKEITIAEDDPFFAFARDMWGGDSNNSKSKPEGRKMLTY